MSYWTSLSTSNSSTPSLKTSDYGSKRENPKPALKLVHLLRIFYRPGPPKTRGGQGVTKTARNNGHHPEIVRDVGTPDIGPANAQSTGPRRTTRRLTIEATSKKCSVSTTRRRDTCPTNVPKTPDCTAT